MENFFLDNKDLLFRLEHLDMEKIVNYKEKNFEEAKKYKFAPVNYDDAMDSYKKILEVVGDICANIVAPLSSEVDEEGARLINGEVVYAKGTQVALDALKKAELFGLPFPRKYGGLNVPMTIYTMVIEIISRADASLMNVFGLQADIGNTILKFASNEIKEKYIPKLVYDNVTTAMILTEPDAGSDLQSVMLKAKQDKNGDWYLKGVKRFITNGNGDISLVLARSEENTKDARGLSMFLYERDSNMKIRRIENKLGIHGSPTCELQFNNAKALLIGERRMGLIKYVMSLMNEARIGVSAQALGIAEAAYREALKYANERIQFKKKIIQFYPVSEMLIDMKVNIEAGRALLYETTRIVDLKETTEEFIKENPSEKLKLKPELRYYTSLASLLTPMSKAFLTEMCNKVTYDALQIHGGTGYMKDFNIERHYRDARITNIYEGTTQLQIVAAINGIMNGTINTAIEKIIEQNDFTPVESLYKKALKIKKILIESVRFVKEKEDKNFVEYHARRLVEIGTYAFISFLLLKDSLVSERKMDICNYFLDKALLDSRKKSDFIFIQNDTIFNKTNFILEENNLN